MIQKHTVPGDALAKSDDESVENIGEFYYRYYQKYFDAADVLVICVDGCKANKPAVREARDKRAVSKIEEFVKLHSAATDLAMLRRFGRVTFPPSCSLSDAPPCKVANLDPWHTEARCARGKHVFLVKGAQVERKEGCAILAYVSSGPSDVLDSIDGALNDRGVNALCEADTFMFAAALAIKDERPDVSIAIESKDSDVLGTLCMLKEPGIQVVWTNDQYRFVKDHDEVFNHNLAYSRTDDSKAAIWDRRRLKNMRDKYASWMHVMLDASDLSDFPDLVTTWNDFQSLLHRLDISSRDFNEKCVENGLRGSLYRRLMARALRCRGDDRCETALESVLFADYKTSNKEFIQRLFTSMPGFGVGTDAVTAESSTKADGFNLLARATHSSEARLLYSGCDECDELKLARKRWAMAALYSANLIPPNTYGEYLALNRKGEGGRLNVSLQCGSEEEAHKAQTAGVLAVIAGTDYNLTIPGLGEMALMRLWDSQWFLSACASSQKLERTLLSPKVDPIESVKAIVDAAKVKLKKDFEDRHMTVSWKTFRFACDTWLLKNPTADESYGFVTRNGALQFAIDDEFEDSL